MVRRSDGCGVLGVRGLAGGGEIGLTRPEVEAQPAVDRAGDAMNEGVFRRLVELARNVALAIDEGEALASVRNPLGLIVWRPNWPGPG